MNIDAKFFNEICANQSQSCRGNYTVARWGLLPESTDDAHGKVHQRDASGYWNEDKNHTIISTDAENAAQSNTLSR